MQLIILTTYILSLVAAVSCFAIPTKQGDGIYSVRRSPSGEEIHTYLGSPASRRATPPAFSSPFTPGTSLVDMLRRLQWGQVHCYCGSSLDHKDTDAAVGDLKDKLGNDVGQTIKPHEAVYSVKGSVVAYVCNLDGNAPMRAWSSVVSGSTQKISNACGKFMAGDTGGITGVAVGYVKYDAETKFCDEALTAGADRCDSRIRGN